MNCELKKVAVYCASSTQIDDCYFKDARRLGHLMAGQGVTLVNGAGNMGLMAESANGCIEKGGRTIGVIPTFMIKEGWPSKRGCPGQVPALESQLAEGLLDWLASSPELLAQAGVALLS